MRLVTANCPLTTNGTGETVLQTAGGTRLVVDCKVNPTALVGHVKMTFAPYGISVRQPFDSHRFILDDALVRR